jgi:hypothetical protein
LEKTTGRRTLLAIDWILMPGVDAVVGSSVLVLVGSSVLLLDELPAGPSVLVVVVVRRLRMLGRCCWRLRRMPWIADWGFAVFSSLEREKKNRIATDYE